MKALILLLAFAPMLSSQVRVDNNKHTRLQRFARDMAYGTAEGLGFAAVDQSRNSPPEWGSGSQGFERRAASDIGEFVIQESVTEGVAAIMQRPLDYTRCECAATGDRLRHAVYGAVVDYTVEGQRHFAL